MVLTHATCTGDVLQLSISVGALLVRGVPIATCTLRSGMYIMVVGILWWLYVVVVIACGISGCTWCCGCVDMVVEVACGGGDMYAVVAVVSYVHGGGSTIS